MCISVVSSRGIMRCIQEVAWHFQVWSKTYKCWSIASTSLTSKCVHTWITNPPASSAFHCSSLAKLFGSISKSWVSSVSEAQAFPPAKAAALVRPWAIQWGTSYIRERGCGIAKNLGVKNQAGTVCSKRHGVWQEAAVKLSIDGRLIHTRNTCAHSSREDQEYLTKWMSMSRCDNVSFAFSPTQPSHWKGGFMHQISHLPPCVVNLNSTPACSNLHLLISIRQLTFALSGSSVVALPGEKLLVEDVGRAAAAAAAVVHLAAFELAAWRHPTESETVVQKTMKSALPADYLAVLSPCQSILLQLWQIARLSPQKLGHFLCEMALLVSLSSTTEEANIKQNTDAKACDLVLLC